MGSRRSTATLQWYGTLPWRAGALGAAIAAVAASCGAQQASQPSVCIPGRAVSCGCPGQAEKGTQNCLPDGTGFEACICGNATSGAGGTGGKGGGTSVSTGQGGGCNAGKNFEACELSMCTEQLCPAEVQACQQSPDCKAVVKCWNGCLYPSTAAAKFPSSSSSSGMSLPPPLHQGGGHPTSCFEGCLFTYPNGSQTMFKLYACAVCEKKACFIDCEGKTNCATM